MYYFAFLIDIAQDQHYEYQVLYDGMQVFSSISVISLIVLNIRKNHIDNRNISLRYALTTY